MFVFGLICPKTRNKYSTKYFQPILITYQYVWERERENRKEYWLTEKGRYHGVFPTKKKEKEKGWYLQNGTSWADKKEVNKVSFIPKIWEA